MDKEFAAAGGKFVVCVRKDYTGLVDDQYPDDLPVSMLQKLDEGYRRFLESTDCSYFLLETDDMNLNNQVEKIKMFLEVE